MSDEHCGAWWAFMSMLAEIVLVGVGMGLVVWVVRRLQYL